MMDDTQAELISIQVGRIAPLGPEAVPSAFVKRPVTGAIAVGPLGLEGDEQADLSVHGGPDKAVYGYASAQYPAWAADFPQHAARLVWGAFGENLTISGLIESELRVGDMHRIGTALLQVCQPRQPCFKFGLHFEDSRMPRAMVRNGRAGWYYRVLEAGQIAPGDAVTLVQRPHDFRFDRLVEIMNYRNATQRELEQLAGMDGVAERIRAAAWQPGKLGS